MLCFAFTSSTKDTRAVGTTQRQSEGCMQAPKAKANNQEAIKI